MEKNSYSPLIFSLFFNALPWEWQGGSDRAPPHTERAAHARVHHYLIRAESSLNSGVPARCSHSKITISVVATSTPLAASRAMAA